MTYCYPNDHPFESAPTKKDLADLSNLLCSGRMSAYIWFCKLTKAYKNTPEQIDIVREFGGNINSYIYEQLTLADASYRIHVNVEKANRIAVQKTAEIIPLTYFGDGLSLDGKSIRYTPTCGVNDYHISSQEPIIVVPYFLSSIPYWVIDGNHRITAKIAADIDTVTAVVLRRDEVPPLLATKFERELYLLLTEFLKQRTV